MKKIGDSSFTSQSFVHDKEGKGEGEILNNSKIWFSYNNEIGATLGKAFFEDELDVGIRYISLYVGLLLSVRL